MIMMHYFCLELLHMWLMYCCCGESHMDTLIIALKHFRPHSWFSRKSHLDSTDFCCKLFWLFHTVLRQNIVSAHLILFVQYTLAEEFIMSFLVSGMYSFFLSRFLSRSPWVSLGFEVHIILPWYFTSVYCQNLLKSWNENQISNNVKI